MGIHIRWSESEEKAVLERYRALRAEIPAVPRMAHRVQSQEVLPLERRRKTFSRAIILKFLEVDGGGPNVRTPRKQADPAPNPSKSVSTELTIDDALALLCDAIAARVGADIEKRLEPILAQRIAVAAVKVSPSPLQAQDPNKLRALDVRQLRYELIKAKSEYDEARVKKIVTELSRRETGARVIERESNGEE